MSSQPSTSESSTSSESSDTSITCEVCLAPGHGVHFGVVSCRACAAFFRRTIVHKRQNRYRCRKDQGECSIKPEERYHCKLCRYNKCVVLGMTADNVQLFRDPFPSARMKPKDGNSSDNGMKKSDYVLKLKPKQIVDMTTTKHTICKILNDETIIRSPEFAKLNKLEQMELGLRKWRDQQKPREKLKVMEKVSILELFKIFQQQMLVMARWLSHSEDLRLLNYDQKYTFFKSVWNIWRRLERYQMSLEVFGDDAVEKDLFAVTESILANADIDIDFSSVSNESNEKMRKYFRDPWRALFHQLSKPLTDLQPSSIEMAFMLSELCWQIAGKAMQGKVLEVSERVRDELANNLHDYYRQSEKRPNYAGRLVKLTKIVSSVLKFHSELKKTMELAHIFDVFHVVLSEPDLFDC